MKKFCEGHSYLAADPGYGSITVEKRTNKMIHVMNQNGTRFRMLIRTDENGNEYAIDSSVPKKWREAFTYRSE